MLTKNDLVLLLSELEEKGNKDASKHIKSLLTKHNIDMDALKFITNNRKLDVANFYEHLRKQYNNKHSKLYINIVKEIEKPNDVLTTLSALNLQVLLYGSHLENPEMFYSHVRAEELTRVLNNYYKTYDLTSCIKLLRLIKADLVALEFAEGRRKA